MTVNKSKCKWSSTPLRLLIGFMVVMIALAGNTAQAAEQPETYQDMPVGFTDEGYPFIGSPDAAVTLEEWSDYLCPFCGRHFSQTLPGLLDHPGGRLRCGSMLVQVQQTLDHQHQEHPIGNSKTPEE